MSLSSSATPGSSEFSKEESKEVLERSDRLTVTRSSTAIFLYPLAAFTFVSLSPFGAKHPVLAWSLAVSSLLVAAYRALIDRRIDAVYSTSPDLWRRLFAVGVVLSAICWTGLVCASLYFDGLTWLSFLGLLITAAFSFGALLAFSSSLALIRVYLILMLTPQILVASTSVRESGYLPLIGFLIACLLYLVKRSRTVHREHWDRLIAMRLLEKRAVELEEALSLAEAAAHAKSNFLATMSHEIRTPLAGIIGTAELQLKEDLSPRVREYAGILSSSAKSLQGIIDDILDFSKIEAGKLQIEKVSFSPRDLVAEVYDLLAPRAASKDLELCKDLEQIVSVGRRRGDPLRLRQVLLNLVDNAIKFTEAGRIVIGARIDGQEGETTRLRFTVEDTGVGVKMDAVDELFERFSQADHSTSRRFGGTGLGLTISKKLIELMGGEIGVESAEGEGSTFWFTVPLDPMYTPATGTKDELTSTLEELRARRNRRILVVEDDETNRIVAVAFLEYLGYVAETASSGSEALTALREKKYDLVLMDCRMPGMDGYETTRRLRQWETVGHIPVVALTAAALKGDLEECLAAGMDDYVAKPFREDDLEEVIERLLSAT